MDALDAIKPSMFFAGSGRGIHQRGFARYMLHATHLEEAAFSVTAAWMWRHETSLSIFRDVAQQQGFWL